MRIKEIPVIEIHPATYNPRKTLKPTDAAYQKLEKAIDTFGLVEPLVWNERTGNLVGGHQRFQILLDRGETKVNVSIVDLDDRDEKALNIALNKYSGEWDYASLADLLQELDTGNLDMEITGFSESELEKLMTWTPAEELQSDRSESLSATPRKQLRIETIAVQDLKPHPRNYLSHPPDQLAHLIESIRTHGYYRNVVIARDNTILTGHGIVEAVREMQWLTIPVIRLDLDPNEPKALKVLTGDNCTRNLAEVDDRALSELIKEIKEVDLEGLLGTGFDEMMLANLIFVTRPATEIKSFNEAAEWVGLPHYDEPEIARLTLHFKTEEDRQACAELLGIELKEKMTSLFWPVEADRDMRSVKFEDEQHNESAIS